MSKLIDTLNARGVSLESFEVHKNTLCTYEIKDINFPFVITFSHAGDVITKTEVENGDINVWGKRFLKKYPVNVISFTCIDKNNWFRCEELFSFIESLGVALSFSNRIFGYGSSMGAGAVSQFSNVLNIKYLLLLNPVSTLNKDLVGFEKRYRNAANVYNWNGKYSDGATTGSKGYIVFDPLFSADCNHAKRYSTLKEIRIPGVGHGIPIHLKYFGLLKPLFESFLYGGFDSSVFYKKLRKRRSYPKYFEWMLSKDNIYLNDHRKAVIEKYRDCQKIMNGGQALINYTTLHKLIETSYKLPEEDFIKIVTVLKESGCFDNIFEDKELIDIVIKVSCEMSNPELFINYSENAGKRKWFLDVLMFLTGGVDSDYIKNSFTSVTNFEDRAWLTCIINSVKENVGKKSFSALDNLLLEIFDFGREDVVYTSNKILVSSKIFGDGRHSGAHIKVLCLLLDSLILAYGVDRVFFYTVSSGTKAQLRSSNYMLKYLVKHSNISNVGVLSLKNSFKFNEGVHANSFIYHYSMSGLFVEENILRRSLYGKGIKTIGVKFNPNVLYDQCYDYMLGVWNSTMHELGLEVEQLNFKYPFKPFSTNDGYKWKFRPEVIKNIATISSGKRLEKAFRLLTQMELDKLFDFLRNNNLQWFFVGCENLGAFLDTCIPPDIRNKFKVIDYVKDFDGFLKDLDVVCYMPRISGGGTGLARSSSKGIPTFAFEGTSAVTYLSKEATLNSFVDLIDALKFSINNKEFAEKISNHNLLFIQSLTLENSAKQLTEYFPG